MGRGNSSSRTSFYKSQTVVPQGRVDVLAYKMMEKGIERIEERFGLNGLKDWVEPIMGKIAREFPRKKVF